MHLSLTVYCVLLPTTLTYCLYATPPVCYVYCYSLAH